MQDIRFFRRSQQYLVAETNRMCSAELIIRDKKEKERVLHGVDVRVGCFLSGCAEEVVVFLKGNK